MPKPGKVYCKKRKPKATSPDEHNSKNPQQNTS